MKIWRILIIFLVVLAAGGCNSMPPEAMEPSALPSLELQVTPPEKSPRVIPTVLPTQGEQAMTIPSLPAPYPPELQNLVDKAKEHLADQLALPVGQIHLLAAYEVVWPDASLGCPQEGMAYVQVLTPGYLIHLGSGNLTFEYHSGKGDHVIYCANPSPALPGIPDSN